MLRKLDELRRKQGLGDKIRRKEEKRTGYARRIRK